MLLTKHSFLFLIVLIINASCNNPVTTVTSTKKDTSFAFTSILGTDSSVQMNEPLLQETLNKI